MELKIENIKLGSLSTSNLSYLSRWRNELMDNFRQWFYLNEVNQEEWFKSISKNDKYIMLGVFADLTYVGEKHGKFSNALIGVVGLTYVDWVRRKAEASIYLAKEYGGYGAGTLALKLLCEYGFNTVNLNRIYAEIYLYNEGSIRLFEKVGFKLEGELRESNYRFGKYSNSYVYGLLKNEFVK